MPAHNAKDLTGRVFGHWTVLSQAPSRKGVSFWLCKCACGTERELRYSNLVYRQGSCGCVRRARNALLPGRVFGRLTVIEEGPVAEWGQRRWWMLCVCGRRRLVEGSALRKGHTKSCGCLALEKSAEALRKKSVDRIVTLERQGYKRCTSCFVDKPLTAFDRSKKEKYVARCKACRSLKSDQKKYGLVQGVTRQSLLEKQFGCCPCCGRSVPTAKGWHIDHDHKTGQVRGVLCGSCNQALGLANDDPRVLVGLLQYRVLHARPEEAEAAALVCEALGIDPKKEAV